MNIQSINIFKSGVQKSLGDLEAQIMDALWEAKEPLSAREVTDLLSKNKKTSFNAISTVLSRLEKKELIKRHAKGKRYSFSPIHSKAEYSQSILTMGLRSLLSDKRLLSAAGISGEITDVSSDQKAIDLLKHFIDEHEAS